MCKIYILVVVHKNEVSYTEIKSKIKALRHFKVDPCLKINVTLYMKMS